MSKVQRLNLATFACLFGCMAGLLASNWLATDLAAYFTIAAGVLTIGFGTATFIAARKEGREHG